MKQALARWLDAAFRPIDAASVAVFRVLFGVIMVWEVLRYTTKGWVADYYIEPDFQFKYIFFEWVEPWPGLGMYVHFAVLGVLGALIAVGLWTRLACALFFVGFGYVFLLEQAHYLNHLYLVVMLVGLLAFLPLDHMLSVRAWRDPAARSQTVPAWVLWVLRLTVAVPYFFGGVAKLNWDWLRGQPMVAWMAKRADMPLVGPVVSHPDVALGMAWGGALYDLAVVPLLLWRRTRTLALVLSFSFHLSNHFLFSIGIFPWLMMAATLLFLDPDWPREAFPWLFERFDRPEPEGGGFRSWPRRGPVLVGIGLFVAYNVFMPFRHLLYPGNPSWTEEGHRYAWHMKLRNKTGRATFQLVDPEAGERWMHDPQDHLTRRQYRKMRSRPDMVLQYAHKLRDEARAEGREQIQVYAHVRAALNTRRTQALIDPTVDLAQVERDLWHAEWIVPLEEPLPGWDW